jgi:hypothetical protein
MLRIFTNLNKYGTPRNRIIHVPDGKPFTHGPGYGPIVISRVFKYEYTGSTSPSLVSFNGKKYIVPSWQEVLPETTLNDIEWVKPQVEAPPPAQSNTWKFQSKSSPDQYYIVRQNGSKLSCNCSGFWRAKDREKGCVHIQQVRSNM